MQAHISIGVRKLYHNAVVRIAIRVAYLLYILFDAFGAGGGGVDTHTGDVLWRCMGGVAVSYATQKERVKLGYFQVFFCEDYDEKYAKIDTLKD